MAMQHQPDPDEAVVTRAQGGDDSALDDLLQRYRDPVFAFVFRLVGQNRGTVEFLIATEGEMKKVNWSTRKEVIGATKVVIVTVLALGFLLFFVNLFFLFLFETIGVLRVGGAAAALTPVGQ